VDLVRPTQSVYESKSVHSLDLFPTRATLNILSSSLLLCLSSVLIDLTMFFASTASRSGALAEIQRACAGPGHSLRYSATTEWQGWGQSKQAFVPTGAEAAKAASVSARGHSVTWARETVAATAAGTQNDIFTNRPWARCSTAGGWSCQVACSQFKTLGQKNRFHEGVASSHPGSDAMAEATAPKSGSRLANTYSLQGLGGTPSASTRASRVV
jgi:hypothetical protein